MDLQTLSNGESFFSIRTKLNTMLQALITGDEGANAIWAKIRTLVASDTTLQGNIDTLADDLSKQLLDANDYTDARVTAVKAIITSIDGNFYGFYANSTSLPTGSVAGYAYVATTNANEYTIWNYIGSTLQWINSGMTKVTTTSDVPLVVSLTNTSGVYSADKTSAEIATAFGDKSLIVFKYEDGTTVTKWIVSTSESSTGKIMAYNDSSILTYQSGTISFTDVADNVRFAKNNIGATVAKGKLVYISGSTGENPLFLLATNTDYNIAARTWGMTYESINNNAVGRVINFGMIENLDTSAYTAGTELWLGVNGAFTNIRPTSPAFQTSIGMVIRQSATVGSIFVNMRYVNIESVRSQNTNTSPSSKLFDENINNVFDNINILNPKTGFITTGGNFSYAGAQVGVTYSWWGTTNYDNYLKSNDYISGIIIEVEPINSTNLRIAKINTVTHSISIIKTFNIKEYGVYFLKFDNPILLTNNEMIVIESTTMLFKQRYFDVDASYNSHLWQFDFNINDEYLNSWNYNNKSLNISLVKAETAELSLLEIAKNDINNLIPIADKGLIGFNNINILNPKTGFITTGGNFSSTGSQVLENEDIYWFFKIFDNIPDGIDITVFGIIIEVGYSINNSGTERIVYWDINDNTIHTIKEQVIDFEDKTISIMFDTPIIFNNKKRIGVIANKTSVNHRYTIGNNDYGLIEQSFLKMTENQANIGTHSLSYPGMKLNIAPILNLTSEISLIKQYVDDKLPSVPKFDFIEPKIIYNTYVDAKNAKPTEERAYQGNIYLDHLLYGLSEEFNIRFGNNKDVIYTNAPVYQTSGEDFPNASYIANNNQNYQELNISENLKVNNELKESFTVKNRIVKASASFTKKALLLCIGDSITDGQQSLLAYDNYQYRYSFHDIAKELFMKDKIDANLSSDNLVLLGTKHRQRLFNYNSEQYLIDDYNEGYGGSGYTTWINGTVGGGLFKNETSNFSIKTWVNRYRTLSDNGDRLYFNNLKGTTGIAGVNIAYLEDGTLAKDSNNNQLYLGTLITDTTLYNVCVPTHVHINLGANETMTESYWQDFIDKIKIDYPNIIIGLSTFDSAGTYFPSLHLELDDVYTRWNQTILNPNIGIQANISYHDRQFASQVALENFYGKESDNIYVLPFYYCTDPINSAESRKLSTPVDEQMNLREKKIPYSWGALYHISAFGHAQCGYQLYSWLRWTLTDKN